MMDSLAFPSLSDLEQKLEPTADPTRPRLSLGELEELHGSWPYAKGLEHRSGYVYADLCFQLGWAHFHQEEYEDALKVWRLCPWVECEAGERAALSELLNTATEEKTLVLAPPVSVLLASERIQLSEVVGALESGSTGMAHSGSGQSYIFTASILRPHGVNCLTVECDPSTLFFASLLPQEVAARLNTARSFFQMGDSRAAAGWLLRAAHAAFQAELSDHSRSFLTKAHQLDPENEAVRKSVTHLNEKGVGENLLSRVVVERTLMQPQPFRRSAHRPAVLPASSASSLAELQQRSEAPLAALLNRGYQAKADSEVQTLPAVIREFSTAATAVEEWVELFSQPNCGTTWCAMLVPKDWTDELSLKFSSFEGNRERALALGLEGAAVWNRNLRAEVDALLQEWQGSSSVGVPSLEELDLGEPPLALLAVGLEEAWQLPLLLLHRGQDALEILRLVAWLRKCQKKFGGRLIGASPDTLLLYFPELPESDIQRSRFLGDFLNLSQHFGESFEPSYLMKAGDGVLIPVPWKGFEAHQE